MDLIFSIFEGILMAAGPFCVFSGMGTGSRTGNLSFRGFTSSDNSVTIIDGPTNITFSAIGSVADIKIDNFEIAFGGLTGLTSSSACVFTTTNRTAIVNIDTWNTCNFGPYSDNNSSGLFFDTYLSCITEAGGGGGVNLVTIGGKRNCFIADSGVRNKRNVILGGQKNLITNSGYATRDNTISSSYESRIGIGSNGSTIVSSTRGYISRSNRSSIISSRNAVIGQQYVNTCNKYNTILSSNGGSIGYSYGLGVGTAYNVSNTIISGDGNYITNYDVLNNGTTNNIFFGTNNRMFGDYAGRNLHTSNTNLISGVDNKIRSSRSAIISSNYACICDYVGYSTSSELYNNLVLSSFKATITTAAYYTYYSYINKQNSIISSECSTVCNYGYYFPIRNSIISSNRVRTLGYCNNIISSSFLDSKNSKNSIILSSRGTSVQIFSDEGGYNSLISSSGSCVGNTYNSTVISSLCSKSWGGKGEPIAVVASKSSCVVSAQGVIISSHASSVCSSKNSVIISSKSSCICSGNTSSIIISSGGSYINESFANSIISAYLSSQIYSQSSTILGGCCNTICNSNSSTIIGGNCNKIDSASFSAILGGGSIILTQSNTVAVESLFIKDCFFVGPTLIGIDGTWVCSSNTVGICRGIVTSLS